jgi:hypothetical protein
VLKEVQQSNLAKKSFKNIKIEKQEAKNSFTNFEIPLYFSTKQEVKFGLTSRTERICFANPILNGNKL